MRFRAALVTGGSRRLGREIALGLGRRGCSVAVHYATSAEKAHDTAAVLKDSGVNAVAVQGDLLQEDTCQNLISRAAGRLGRPLDLLVNNASIFEFDSIDDVTEESWHRHMMVNLRAPCVLIREFSRQVPEPAVGCDGESVPSAAVVNVIDQRVRNPDPEFFSYILAKMGLWNLTGLAAQALAPRIRVNAIGPGPVVQGYRQSRDHFRRQRRNTPLKRGARPIEIVGAVEFILDSPSMTGELICLDGGQHLV